MLYSTELALIEEIEARTLTKLNAIVRYRQLLVELDKCGLTLEEWLELMELEKLLVKHSHKLSETQQWIKDLPLRELQKVSTIEEFIL